MKIAEKAIEICYSGCQTGRHFPVYGMFKHHGNRKSNQSNASGLEQEGSQCKHEYYEQNITSALAPICRSYISRLHTQAVEAGSHCGEVFMPQFLNISHENHMTNVLDMMLVTTQKFFNGFHVDGDQMTTAVYKEFKKHLLSLSDEETKEYIMMWDALFHGLSVWLDECNEEVFLDTPKGVSMYNFAWGSTARPKTKTVRPTVVDSSDTDDTNDTGDTDMEESSHSNENEFEERQVEESIPTFDEIVDNGNQGENEEERQEALPTMEENTNVEECHDVNDGKHIEESSPMTEVNGGSEENVDNMEEYQDIEEQRQIEASIPMTEENVDYDLDLEEDGNVRNIDETKLNLLMEFLDNLHDEQYSSIKNILKNPEEEHCKELPNPSSLPNDGDIFLNYFQTIARRKKGEKAIRRELRKSNIDYNNVRGDGNCWFRCISFQLQGTESNHLLWRSILCQWMIFLRQKKEMDKEKALDWFDVNFDWYDQSMLDMSENGSYIDGYGMQALELLLQRRTIVLSEGDEFNVHSTSGMKSLDGKKQRILYMVLTDLEAEKIRASEKYRMDLAEAKKISDDAAEEVRRSAEVNNHYICIVPQYKVH